MKKKGMKKMKEDIRMIRSSDELNKKGKKFKTTKLYVKIVEMHKIKKIIFLSTYTKCLKLETVFTT